MNHEQWPDNEVRLFPSVHIKGQREAELRATASLLAVVRAVSEFGRRIVRLSHGSAGRLACYTEVSFDVTNDGKVERIRPDGVLRVQRGNNEWVAFLEVKVGAAELDQSQVDQYHRLARERGAQALLTVSNQPARSDGSPPLNINRRWRTVPVVHFSWERLLSEAQTISRRKEVSDPDQKWMLDEWIRYVEDPESSIIVPPDLGDRWPQVLKAARTNELSQAQADLADVAQHWVGYLRKLGFRLRAKLGADVEVRLSRKERTDPDLQAAKAINLQDGSLSGALRIPGAAGDVSLRVLLPSRTVQYVLEVPSPTEGRVVTRLKWLARWLRPENLPSDLEVAADWRLPGRRQGFTTTCKVGEYLEEPSRLGSDAEGLPVAKGAEPRSLRLTWNRSLTTGRRSAPVLEDISRGLEDFYHKVVQDVRPFVARAPKMAEEEQPAIISTEPDQKQETPETTAPTGGEPGSAEAQDAPDEESGSATSSTAP